MNKKKVDLLLINPPFHRRNGSGSIFPLGLGYIIAAAKKEGYTCDVINGYSMIDSYANESLSDFEIKLQNLLETYDPVLVGIGPCITTQLRALQIIARCCLTIYGDDRVYAGGPLASIDGQEWLFFELLRIRYIVKGDGEEAICQMIRCLKNGGSLAQCNYVSRSGYAFVSILKEVCSQRGHFTYITDNCRPANLRYYNAFSAYLSILNRLTISVDDFLRQFVVSNGEANLVRLIDQSTICCGDARKMSWVDNQSVDLILTSPPYLCAQDYIKTMRLNNLFFPNEGFDKLPGQEIGSRASRKRKNGPEVVNKFYDDMRAFCGEAERVLKKNKFFCLIIGQGKAKAIEGHDTIGELSTMIIQDFGFQKIYETSRTIGYKWNRLGGVDHEKIIIFQKK